MPDKSRTKKTGASSDSNPTESTETGGSPTFEEALTRLEEIIEQLEKPDLTLDRSLEFFEKGIVLIRTCDAHLKKAQGKVAELLKGENGEFAEKVLGITLESFIAKDTSDE
jgi:exodeoxyribonuclease VII small subunit